MTVAERSAWTLVVLLAAATFSWPALYNGQPLYFADTSAYVRGVDAAVMRATGRVTAWSRRPTEVDTSPDAVRAAGQSDGRYRSLSSIEDRAVLSGRSAYYGALLYVGNVGGEFWLVVLTQAAMVVAALALTLRACMQNTWQQMAVLVAVGGVSSAPFFVSFLMPDLMASLTILASAVLMTRAAYLRPAERAFWFLLLTYSLLAHSANILIVTSLTIVAFVTFVVAGRKTTSATGLAVTSLAIALAILGEVMFTFAVNKAVGAAPIRPPFLMARAIDDGPGYRYLRETCPQNGLAVCRFLDRLPLPADRFLWFSDPERGVFAVADPKTRRALSQEQVRFWIAVWAYDPAGQAKASFSNALHQATQMSLREFNYPEKRSKEFAAKLPAENFRSMQATAAYRQSMPVRWPSLVTYWLSAIGLGYIAYAWLESTRRSGAERPISLRIAGLVVAGVAINAAVCGALSTPHNRYQARVMWLVPIIAIVLDFERRRDWWCRALRLARAD